LIFPCYLQKATLYGISGIKKMIDTVSLSNMPAASPPGRKPLLARVEIHESPAEILDIWAQLETNAACSAYQTRAFLLTWIATVGAACRIKPIFVTARDNKGEIIALLPLGIERRGGISRMIFLGGKESNFNLGLFPRPDIFIGSDMDGLLRMIARALGPKAPDVFVLLNQPYSWDGVTNPLSLLPHQPSPSYAYEVALPRDPQVFFSARQSKERRKKLRKKEARLAAMGKLTHITNECQASTQAILSAFFAQKTLRCEQQALDTDFSDPNLQQFYEILSKPSFDRGPAMELHALACCHRIVAVFGGIRFYDRFSGMIISFDADVEIAKSSPGELLLTRVISAQCGRGVTTFDLGIGEADYKDIYCDTPVPLFDAFLPITVKGRAYSIYESLLRRLRRSIKQKREFLHIMHRVKRFLWRYRF
jgi:CelD/BcsL family acetyltransferase involved in cellulose biosynthesis